MAGVTNVAFRTLCRELEEAKVGTVSGLYVCEMVTARALVERHPVTMHMTTFAPDESPRSLQLYTVDPDTTYAAARMIAEEGLADHIDMNFGCPVPKVTKRGGGPPCRSSDGCSARSSPPRCAGSRAPTYR
ncbi:dihydrouridine synthase family protein [Mycobacterium ulcerans str. Harvey]|uniref:Dihydrouridine synthase family protein n=1 Tax=Mycobacterium ulcerans str. Harvey TaxID=1299332 RepID=A0ABP3ANJ4_MYCUL|nr:dihydrouridine synthase family protein [Mycobacterium ulcerans str. Harvey]